ncbi:hypothetical protein HMPREF3190_01199 [Umbribacter vaginalis]|nr:hypothetical protein HMPREF3190_01199 [Coriobacteriales bacterium DNF00809]
MIYHVACDHGVFDHVICGIPRKCAGNNMVVRKIQPKKTKDET